MRLIKIYANDCQVCAELGNQHEKLAFVEGWKPSSIELEEFAATSSPLRDYVVSYHVSPEDGMVDLPIYVITTPEGLPQASGVIKEISEVVNLIDAWKLWASSQKEPSADQTTASVSEPTSGLETTAQ